MNATTAAIERAWLRSARLALAEFVPQDEEAVVAMHADERVRAHLIEDYPLHERRVAREFLRRLGPYYRRHEGLGIWHALLLGPAPTSIGWFNLMPFPGRDGEVEIGGRLLPSTWGKGLAQEGGAMLLDYAFDRLGLARVWGTCHPDNRSAQGVLAALGFESMGRMPYEGTQAEHFMIRVNRWRELRDLSPSTRMRRALRQRRTSEEKVECTPIDA
jgi:RimJ/RimL family protein N-acetyltransferase